MMDIRFLPHNLHIEGLDVFTKQDPNFRALNRQKLVYKSALIDQLPQKIPGIYTITGGRQIGKTTLLKQWMAHLIENGHPPELITYFTGELIDDHHALVRIITDSLLIPNNISGKTEPQYLLLDEITYINNWDKGVKYRADSGFLENIVMVLTGSDLVVIKEARMRFPGRRGISDTVDFQLFPLSFYEYVKLNNRITNNEICALVEDKKKSGKNWIDILYEEFENSISMPRGHGIA